MLISHQGWMAFSQEPWGTWMWSCRTAGQAV